MAKCGAALSHELLAARWRVVAIEAAQPTRSVQPLTKVTTAGWKEKAGIADTTTSDAPSVRAATCSTWPPSCISASL
eukprot:CAMPEP_0202874612 /NCGR_PEP_ID=MMETSP1391-20130828/25723_1 /ASSEMBLY_ACC=CAM_ASM_000867 /TAXON_ID=1034604 /ORGANISM="Chlamydomonas leiostraca, Strain SAG 11-49" /LENGTH=76 /DNA_ID=CAMNT_0049556089 /DNA_START=806 /DNA_END=1036 /DNA_ORIENTATION=+